MERSTRRFHVAAAVLYSLMLWSDVIVGSMPAVTTSSTAAVPIGVVLDLTSDMGRRSLSCVSMALEDFYAEHPNYATRVGLHVRDTHGDLDTASHAAEDLIKNAQVQAIIVRPQTSAEADLFAQLGSRNRILVLSFSDISTTLRLHTTPFFVHTSVEESLQIALIADILTSLSWHEAIFVCEDWPYGSGVHQALSDALQRNKIHTMDSVVVPIAVTDDQLDQILYRLKEKHTRLFIVHMRPALTAHLFSKVKYAGMITEDYVWIASIALDNLVESLSLDDSDYLQGILTLQPVQFTRHKARYPNNPGPDDLHDPSLLFWAYEIARLSSSALWMAETEFGKNGVSASRRAPLHSIIDASFDALAGRYKLVNGERQLPSYEIVIATAKGAVGVRSWTQFYFLPQDLSTEGSSFLNSRSGSGTVKPVFWQEDSVMASERHENIGFTRELETKPSANPEAKRRKLDGENLRKMCGVLPKVPLKIGLPRKDGFKEFLNVLPPYLSCHNNSSLPSTTEQITGCSMDFFKAAMTKIQLDHRCYEFCVFEGTYDALVRDVSLGNLDGAVGDLTITSERTKGADFTMPYTQSGVYLLVLGENDMESIQWIFVKPLTWKLWFATVVFFFFTGFVVWMIERPRNPAYQGSRLRQFITASYFSFSTLTFSHDQIIKSPLSKIVVVIWCFVVLILVQSYTASLSSMLTAEKLRPSVKDLDQLLKDGDNVGYQTGSFVHSILRSKGWNDDRLSNYSTKEQYAEALRKGSKDGGVSAIVEEIPFLTSFLSDPQYQKEFKMIKTIYKTPGFGFVFPLGFPLLHNLSTAILNVTGGDEGSQIQAKWLGTDSPSSNYDRPNPDSTPLTLQSFSGLFITSGCISLAMLLISIAKLLRARWTERDNNVQSICSNAFGEESGPLQNSISNASVLDQPHAEDRNDGNQGANGSGVTVGVKESHAIQNDMGNSQARDQLGEAISNNSQGIHRNGATAPSDEPSAVHNGFVPAQSFQIEMNTV